MPLGHVCLTAAPVKPSPATLLRIVKFPCPSVGKAPTVGRQFSLFHQAGRPKEVRTLETGGERPLSDFLLVCHTPLFRIPDVYHVPPLTPSRLPTPFLPRPPGPVYKYAIQSLSSRTWGDLTYHSVKQVSLQTKVSSALAPTTEELKEAAAKLYSELDGQKEGINKALELLRALIKVRWFSGGNGCLSSSEPRFARGKSHIPACDERLQRHRNLPAFSQRFCRSVCDAFDFSCRLRTKDRPKTLLYGECPAVQVIMSDTPITPFFRESPAVKAGASGNQLTRR